MIVRIKRLINIEVTFNIRHAPLMGDYGYEFTTFLIFHQGTLLNLYVSGGLI